MTDIQKKALRDLLETENPIFYFYHNWGSDQENRIHLGHCSDCNYGLGKHPVQTRGENGVWIGPFDSVELICQYLNDNELTAVPPEVHCCKRCLENVDGCH